MALHTPQHGELTTWLNSHSMARLLPTPTPGFTVPIEKKLEEFSVEEAEVLQILTQVNVVRRECEIVSVRGGRGLKCSPEPVVLPSRWGLHDRHLLTPLPSTRNWRRPTLMKKRRSTNGSS